MPTTNPLPRDQSAARISFCGVMCVSVMAVLVKQGKDALAKRLAEIKSVEHLKQLADAQHLGINRSLTREDFVRRATGERFVEHPPLEDPLPSDAAP